jgi:hypothetical protein
MRPEQLEAEPNVLAAMRYLADKKPDRYHFSVSNQGAYLRELDRFEPTTGFVFKGGEWWAPFWARFATYNDARTFALGYHCMHGDGI